MTEKRKIQKKLNNEKFLLKNPNYYKDYRLKHREKAKKYLKEYFKNPDNKLKKLENDRQRYQMNKEADIRRRRNATLKSQFGITLDDYNIMLKTQNDVCAICFNSETDADKKSGKIRSLAVDHCHKTNKIRGLLCRKCNTAIGLLKDDINIINNCVNYLTKGR